MTLIEIFLIRLASQGIVPVPMRMYSTMRWSEPESGTFGAHWRSDGKKGVVQLLGKTGGQGRD